MLHSTFTHLHEGDLVRHVNGQAIYVVHANYGDHVTAVRTVDISNEAEWLLIYKASHKLMVGEMELGNGNETE